MKETNETNQLLKELVIVNKELIEAIKEQNKVNSDIGLAVSALANSNREILDTLLEQFEDEEDEQEQPTYLNSRD